MASLITGIVSVASTICCCIPLVGVIAYVTTPLLGVTAVVTGVMGIQEANRTGVGKNESIVGIVLGSIGVLFGIVGVGMLLFMGGMSILGAAASQPPTY